MSSVHTITAEIEARFTFPGLAEGEHETAYPTIEIQYSFVQGWAGSRPSFSCPGEPPEPDEVDLISARLIAGDGLEPTDERVQEWARMAARRRLPRGLRARQARPGSGPAL
jgi:hypothetical protein